MSDAKSPLETGDTKGSIPCLGTVRTCHRWPTTIETGRRLPAGASIKISGDREQRRQV